MKEHEENGEMEDGSEAILCREGDNHFNCGLGVRTPSHMPILSKTNCLNAIFYGIEKDVRVIRR